MKSIVSAVLVLIAAAARAAGPLPNPPPFAEVLTREGIGGFPLAPGYPIQSQVPSSVATSGNGGGSGRRPSVATAQPRFFFAGNGRLVLHHGHFNTTLDVRYRHADGSYDPAALAQINHFFRSREDGRETPISLRLVELLAYIQARYHPQEMTLMSGFRSPQFNADLRAAGGQAAQASLHTEGLAADVAFTGVDIARLWHQLRNLRTGGAGYYHTGKFLHIDTGPPRFWEETTSRVGENLSAGNARVFLRTDFDRYPHIEGAVCSLHSVTVFPLLIAAHAEVIGPEHTTTITLAPADQDIQLRDGCLAIATPALAHRLRVVGVDAAVQNHADERSRVVLTTCAPRIEKTPEHIESSPIELGGR